MGPTDTVTIFKLTKKIITKLFNISLILLYQNCHIATETKSYTFQLPEREAFDALLIHENTHFVLSK